MIMGVHVRVVNTITSTAFSQQHMYNLQKEAFGSSIASPSTSNGLSITRATAGTQERPA
jgi:hypothetical protein